MSRRRTDLNELLVELFQDTNYYRLRRQRYWDVPSAIKPQYIIALRRILTENQLLKQEIAMLQDKIVRTKADFENFRKRTQKERVELIQRANEALMSHLLNVLDNFERGLKSAHNLDEAGKNFFDGISMSYNELLRVLSENGLQKIDAEGKTFDPYYHEAVGTEHHKELPENQIVSVIRDGYIFKGKVIRPAMVVVNKKD
ncbi:nucleotide exchange factor GrpE [Candidatus Sumerlaeota bacterium]|nr:nucleotide exchange factor GrpE [Candidatus Sumerlaeota bacterium]